MMLKCRTTMTILKNRHSLLVVLISLLVVFTNASCQTHQIRKPSILDVKGSYDHTVILTYNEFIRKFVGSIRYECEEYQDLSGQNCECFLSFISTDSIIGDSIPIIGFGTGGDEPGIGVIKFIEDKLVLRFDAENFFYCQKVLDLENGEIFQKDSSFNENILYLMKDTEVVYEFDTYSSEQEYVLSSTNHILIIEKKENWFKCKDSVRDYYFWLPCNLFLGC